MTTKLVVSLDGLLLTNQNTVVSSRSIDEVVLVNDVTGFNGLTPTQRSEILSRKNNNIGSATLSVALAAETSGQLSDDFYNFLSTNNISFINDPTLASFSSSEVLTSDGSETLSEITTTKISTFNTNDVTQNKLYVAGSSLSLGSSFGSKPSITLVNPTFLDDLSGSVSVTLTATQFANILSSSHTGTKIDVSSTTDSISGLFRTISSSDVSAGFNGSNRLGNTGYYSSDYSGVGFTNSNYFWSEVDASIDVSQALMLPLMGSAPHTSTITLNDTANNLQVGLTTFTTGQMSSFNQIVISDDAVLTLDPATFRSLDTVDQSSSSQSNHNGVSVYNSDGTTKASFKVTGSYQDFIDAGAYFSGGGFTTSFKTDASNLVNQISEISVTDTISSATDVSNLKTFFSSLAPSQTGSSTLTFSSAFLSAGFTTQAFLDLIELDGLTSQNLISDQTAGFNIVDTTDNIKSLLTNNNASVVAVKSSIASISSSSDANEKIQLSWEEYMGAVTGTNFNSTDTSTWTTSSVAFSNLGNIELIVTGTAAELQDIINTYGNSLTNFPAGLTLRILDGNPLTLKQAQLDILDARIEGVVTVSDTSTGIASLLDNAIPTSVQQISSTDTLAITFDQFRNLPNYYSNDVVILDTEDNIVAALNEDLLDDRVTTLVVTTDSTSLGKATSSSVSTSTADSALTVTAAAAGNILSKKVYSQANYDAGNTTTYMDISIVDRGSAIANFIGTATFPGTSSAADVTGAIDFVEKDGGAITLNYNQKTAYDAIPTGILKTSLTSTPVLDAINLSSIAAAIADLDGDVSTAQSAIIANTDTAENNLSTSISTAQSTIVLNTDTAENNLSTSISTAQSTIVLNTDTAENNLSTSISTAQSTIVLNTDTAENNLSTSISTAQSTIVLNTDTAENNLSTSISTAQSTIVLNTDTAENNLSTSISTAQSTIVLNTDTAENNLSTSISTAQSTIVLNTDTAENNLSTSISTAQSTIVKNTDDEISTAESTIVLNTDTAENNLSTSISTAQSTIVKNTDDEISTAESTIVLNTDTAENNLSTSISTAQSTIVKNTDDEISTARSTIVLNTDTAENNLSTSISTAQSTIVKNTDDEISTARSTIVLNTDTAENNLSTSISTAQSTIVKNTDDEISTARSTIVLNTDTAENNLSTSISTAQSTIVLNTDTAENNLSTSISTAQSTIVKNTDDEVSDHQGTISTQITNLSTAVANEKLTVAEAGDSPAAGTDIVDTHQNILTLLGSDVHENIRSIDVLSGDTLKLTSAQFQKLLNAESEAGTVLFAGKIKLATSLSGNYSQVYSQITDYRIALEEGFDASEYSASITPAITVAQGNLLNAAGLTMANQTYDLEDSLSALDTQATDDSTNTLKKAAAVAVDDGTITSANYSKLNNIASVATTAITATVSGSGTGLTSGSPLGNLDTSDKISFKIATGETATAANIAAIALLRDSDSGNYPIEFEGTAKLTGAYTTFINEGAASNHDDYVIVRSQTAGVPIELSDFTTASSAMIEDLNFLLNNAQGVVTVNISDNVDAYSLLTSTSYQLDTSNQNGKTHVVTVDFGTQAVGGATITNLNDLAGQTAITSITGSLTSVTADNVDALDSDLNGTTNSTVSFSLKTDSDGLLTVSQATGLLSHTDQTADGVAIIYGGGITGNLTDYVSAGSETVSTLMQAVISEDADAALTVADNQLTTAANIKDLNALATLSSGTVTATVVTDKGNLLGGSDGATLGTGTGDAITITLNDAATATEYKTLSGKTSGDVTLSAGFSGPLSDFIGADDITSNLDDAFDVTANRNKTITFTDTDLAAAAVAKLNILDSEAKHTGDSAIIVASIEAELADFADLATDATDLITIEISNALTAANVAALNTLKAKTGASITASISGAASALKDLDTDTSDTITISITGTDNEVEDVLLTTNRTSSIDNVSIAGIEDVQAKIAGTSFTSSDAINAAKLNIKTQINSSDASSVTDTTMLDRIYDQVADGGQVVLPTDTTVTVLNAIPISTFTVGDADNAITYDIEDGAGTSDVAGLATATSAVNTAIANAESVTATAALTIAQAVEMLGGVTNSVANSKFTYDIDDEYLPVTQAEGFSLSSDDADEVNKKIAHENAGNVTLTPGTVQNLIGNVSGLTDGSHTYTVRDTLDNLSDFSQNGLDSLLSKATSIQVGSSDEDGNFVAATIDADVSSNRTKFRAIVSNAVDGDTARPITATITGTGSELKGGSDSNPINSTTARNDLITLTVEAPGGSDTGYSVADIATFKGMTKSSTITVTGGIEDSVALLMANDTTRSDNYITALNATEDAALLIDTFTPSATTDITKLNNLFGFSEGPVTATITDTSGNDTDAGGQYILSTAIATLSPGDSDSITVNIGTSTADDDTITELGLLAAKAGVDSIQGTLTLNATRAGDINDDDNLTSSNNKIDYVLSNAITVDAAAALITKTAAPGSVDFDTAGISDTYDKFVDDADSPAALSDNFKKVIGADSGSINDPDVDISISTTLTASKHIDTLNLLTSSSDHTGAITASVQGNQSLLSTITGTNTNTTITATGALSINQYHSIKETTANAIQFSASGSITDDISTLYDTDLAENRHADLHEAITGDNDMNIVVEDTEITSNWDQVNAIAGGEYTGTITATLKGTAAQLTNSGNGWSNLNSTDSAIAFDITSGTASVAQIAMLANDTKNLNIAMTGGTISNDLDDLITDNGAASDGTANFDTAMAHTTDANISIDSAVSVTDAAEIRQINKLIDEAEGNISMSISDTGNVALGDLPITGAASGSTINITLGNITATNDNFSAVSALGAQQGISQITATFVDVEDSHITHLDSLSGFGSSSKYQITFNIKDGEDAISLPQAAILAAATGKSGGAAIDFRTAGVSASTTQLLNDDSDGASAALTAVTAKDGNVNISISDTVETEAEITALNLADSNTTGTVSGNVTTTADLAKDITTVDAKINVVIDDDGTFTLTQFDDLDKNVHEDNTIHLSGVGNLGGGASILDSLENLGTQDDILTAAIAHDGNIGVTLTDGDLTSEDDLVALNAAAAIVGDGGITATVKGTSNLLTNDSGDGGGTGYGNLSDSDAISFEINSGNTTLLHINVLASDTSEQIAISGSGVISAGLNDLVSINDAGAAASQALWTTALANTTGESVTLSTPVEIATTAEIKKLNYLLDSTSGTGVEGNLVASVTDSDANLLLDVGEGRPGLALTGAASGDQITVDLGTFAASTNFLSKLNDLAGLQGIASITANITGMSNDRIAELEDLTSISTDAKFEITYTTTGQITFANAVILAGKTGLSSNTAIDFGVAGITGATTDFVTVTDSGTVTSTNYQAILAKDANVNIDVSDDITDSADVTALNVIDNGASGVTGTTGQVTATVTVSASDAVNLATSSTANTTVSITSGNIGLEAWEDVQGTTANSINLTAEGSTALVQDSNTNFGLHTDIVDAIIDDDADAPFEMTGTISSDAEIVILNDALNRVGDGGIKVSVTSGYTNIASLTNATTNDNITFTVSDNLSPEQLVAIVNDQTSKSTIALGDAAKLQGNIAAFMADPTTLHDDLDDSITALNGSAPSINITPAIALSNTADITKINTLMSNGGVAGVTATITDTNGALIHNGEINLSTASHDAITVSTGTYNLAADSNTQRSSIINLATQEGVAVLSGTVGAVTSADVTALNSAASFEADTSGLALTTSQAISPSAGASLASRGAITYTGGITSADLDDFTAADGEFATTDSINTIITEHDAAPLIYSGDALTDADGVSRINSMAAKTDGAVTASFDATAAILANLSTGSSDQITINLDSSISNSAFETLDGKTGATITFDTANGKLSDSLSGFMDGDSRSTGLSGAISNDGDVKIEITGDAIESSDFSKLQTIAGNDTDGAITASVSGTATDISANLSNLAAADLDQISFTVTSHSGNNKTEILQVAALTAIASDSVDVANITDSYSNVSDVLSSNKIDASDAAVTINGDADFTVGNYNSISGSVGSISFNTIKGSYSDLNTLGASVDLSSKTIEVTDALDKTKLERLTDVHGLTLASLTYTLNDTGATLATMSEAQLQGASSIAVNDSTSVLNLETIRDNSGLVLNDTITYTEGVTDVASVLGGSDTEDILDGKELTLSGTATADLFRRAITNAGAGSVSGAVVETDPDELAHDAGAMTGATSITLTIQSDNQDLTSKHFASGTELYAGQASTRITFNLDGHTGVLFTIDNIDGSTVSAGSGGTYIIKDAIGTIITANANDGAEDPEASSESKFKALYGATEIHATGVDVSNAAHTLAAVGDNATNQSVADNIEGFGADAIKTSAIKVTFDEDTTITDTIASRLSTVTTVELSGADTDLTIEGDALDNSDNEWSSLTTLTGLDSAHNLVITDGTANAGGTIDLYGLSTLTNIDAVSITAGAGADTINLSPELTVSGTTTVDLGSAADSDALDSAGDKIFLNVKTGAFSANSSDVLKYTTINNFDASNDRLGLYYIGFDDSPISAVGDTLLQTSSGLGGVQTYDEDRTFIEEDSDIGYTSSPNAALSNYNSVAEVQEVIADSISTFSDTGGTNRLMYAHYDYVQSDDTNYAIINAADLTGASDSSNLLDSEENFKVVGVAQLAGVSRGSLGTLGGYNLEGTKASTLGGYS